MGYVDSSKNLSVGKGVIQMIRVLFGLVILFTFVGCSSFNAAQIGEKAREAEEALCPLQTARNIDATIDNLLSLVPIIAWNPVCQED